ncbi:FAD-dependent oxidoreductase [Paenibacillus sp. GCM10027626]|uniref:FAD-dependent oxidoreductase n=1 Tax=Paenibacillus sp. GCM10027626 TaxID=3273411 RepID=UPI00362AAE64
MATKGKIAIIAATLCAVAVVCAGGAIAWLWQKKDLVKTDGMVKPEQVAVLSVTGLKDQYDVIVVGTDPEGVAAAISASRNGAKTLLIEPRQDREVLGGLMTVGWLNSIDMNWDKTVQDHGKGKGVYLNKGIFSEWYEQIESHSFDVTTAANAFYKLVKAEPNLDLQLSVKAIEPITSSGNQRIAVKGIKVTMPDGKTQDIFAPTVIDATQDADIAAAAGAEFTIGREDMGDEKARMAVTAVFRLRNVDDHVWKQIAQRVDTAENGAVSGINNWTAWGYAKEMKDYKPVDPERTRMRGLNIGRQKGGTALINALQIFGVDGLDEASRQEGLAIAHREVPHVIEYLKQYPEFANVELDAIAPELYVRETRHLIGLYRLNIVDLLENRDQWDRIAFGSYSADIQSTSPEHFGNVVVQPKKYAVPFRSIVPKGVDGLLVVGRSASFDTLPHGSARVIPVGMATGQAAGAAAVLAAEQNMTFQQLSESKEWIEKLHSRLNEQGMELKPYQLDPEPYMKHKTYPGLKVAVSLGIANGGYHNSTFTPDGESNALRMVNMMKFAGKKFPAQLPGNSYDAVAGISSPEKVPLSLEQAALTIACSLGLSTDLDNAVDLLVNRKVLNADTFAMIADRKQLKEGEMYLLLKDVVDSISEGNQS